jgi:Dolichyl-phosphate-mannose-protein mannosyltransferase
MTSAPVSTDERSKLFLNLTTTQTVCFVLFLYFIVRLPWLITLPIEQAPDEPNHFWVVHYIARHMSLPTFEVVHNTGPAAEYGALPPLGYIPHVLLTALAPDNLAPTISRLGSLIVGAAVPWVAVLLGKELFPRCRYLALALPLLAAFHPQLVFVNSYTNNDSMATALASVIIYMLIRGVKNGLSVGRTAAIGALFGILGLSKHTGLSVGPAVLSGITIAGWANTLSTVQIFTRILAFCATFIAACGWFFVHNFFEFKGDVLGTKTMYESWITILPRENGQVVHPWPRASQIGWWRYVFFDFVGLFGLYGPLYVAPRLLCLPGLLRCCDNGLVQPKVQKLAYGPGSRTSQKRIRR